MWSELAADVKGGANAQIQGAAHDDVPDSSPQLMLVLIIMNSTSYAETIQVSPYQNIRGFFKPQNSFQNFFYISM